MHPAVDRQIEVAPNAAGWALPRGTDSAGPCRQIFGGRVVRLGVGWMPILRPLAGDDGRGPGKGCRMSNATAPVIVENIPGEMKAVPNIPFNIIDVRDVADLHIRAMTNPNAGGQRFLGLAGGVIRMPEIAVLLKNKLPDVSKKVSTRTLPNWVLNLAALFNEQARMAAPLVKIIRNISNAKAKKVLGWTPLANNEEAILAAVKSMVKFGGIK